MTEERLQSLGIPLGPRLRIMEEVKKLSSHLASVQPVSGLYLYFWKSKMCPSCLLGNAAYSLRPMVTQEDFVRLVLNDLCTVARFYKYRDFFYTVEPLHKGHLGDRRKWPLQRALNQSQCMDCPPKNMAVVEKSYGQVSIFNFSFLRLCLSNTILSLFFEAALFRPQTNRVFSQLCIIWNALKL